MAHRPDIPDVRPLLKPLFDELMSVLAALPSSDWEQSTLCPDWTVKDIAAHLLDGNLRRLSFQRDGMDPPPPDVPISGTRDLVAFLNELNRQWIVASRRLSPQVITGLLQWSEPAVITLFDGLDPDGDARFPVTWAGEERSTHRFDMAREYTEKWIHQAQIRNAVAAPLLLSPFFFRPFLQTMIQAFPWRYRDVTAPEGTVVLVQVTGDAGGAWSIVRRRNGWHWSDSDAVPSAAVTVPPEVAWRIFSRSITPDHARKGMRISGDATLAEPALSLTAVMA